MNKLYLTVITIWFLISASAQNKPSILTVLEKDPDMHYKGSNNAFTNKSFADINSSLQIGINMESLIDAISKTGKSVEVPRDIMQTIGALQSFLDNQNAFMQRFRSAIQSYNSEVTGNDAQVFNSVMRELSNKIVAVQALDPVIKQYALQSTSTKRFDPFFDAVRQRLRELRQRSAASAAVEGSTLQMGAWLVKAGVSSSLHLPGFDNIPKGEYYEVARWNFLPSQTQLEQFTQLQKSSYKATFQFQDVFKEALDSLGSQFKMVLSALQSEELLQLFQNLQSTIIGLPQEIKDKIKELQQILNEQAVFVTEKLKYYQSVVSGPINIITVANQAANDITAISKRIEDMKNKITATEVGLSNAINNNNNISGNAQDILVKLKNHLIKLPGIISQQVNTIGAQGFLDLKSNYEFDINSLEFSKDILQLSLKDVPKSTELDLKWTGARNPGDYLVIKTIVRSSDAAGQVLASDERSIELQMFSSHVEGTVGVVLAAPVSSTALKSGFQVAPYYNVLFKGFQKKKQERYRLKGNANDLFTLNLGLHASVPDFNLDGVPEIGLGAVASWLKDYLQGGWAYNFFEKTGYWFIGTRLPIGPFGANSSAVSKNAIGYSTR